MIDVVIKRIGVDIRTPEQYQYNTGQKLRITGDYPESYTVEICNDGDRMPKSAEVPVDGIVPIPDECYADGRDILCYVVYSSQDVSSGTWCTIRIPIIRRPRRRYARALLWV